MDGLSPSEKATLNFYEWEYRGRGYYHFDTPVDIEPPYTPFRFQNYADTVIDDGKVPSLFARIGKLLNPPQQQLEEQQELGIELKPLSVQDTLKGFSFSFPKGEEISALITQEFLAMLSLCNYPVSFEIVSHSKQIQFQFVFSEQDELTIKSNLFAYFPLAKITEINPFDIPFSFERDVAIADFGLRDECMRPIQSVSNYNIDPLAPIISLANFLEKNETALMQIIFRGVQSPWAKDMRVAVSDGGGGSFFTDSPEMPKLAENKTSTPLVSCVFRIAVQGKNNTRSEQIATQYIRHISRASESPYNALIPLSNEKYEYQHHLKNIYYRQSNRFGMLLNTQELSLFAHYPNKTVVSDLLNEDFGRTKLAPKFCFNQKYLFGYNTHEKEQYKVGIDDEMLSKHLLVAGATGTGKTHFLKQLISADIEHQNSSFVLDPHGDLALDMLSLVNESQKDQIVYINIADDSVAFGFNIFEAQSEAEKLVLASDLSSAFADSWISSGDRIKSVLQKTISTLVYSEKKASLLDMKRFLLETNFRNEFISKLDDPVLLYYWNKEFPLVKRHELSPLLLRIDSFMQTRLLRNIFAQNTGINFAELVAQKKLVLINLSVGLIGFENSKFLAKLIITKLNQIVFARQSISKEHRHPIHLYIDEANNYAQSIVVEQVLSGSRKYGLSLSLVLQHLEQVHTQMLNSILSNTGTQVFFRQSDKDAKRIAPSFSFFESEDFMNLARGEALVKVGTRNHDFNLLTFSGKEPNANAEIKNYIIEQSRKHYGTSLSEIDEIIRKAFNFKNSERKQQFIKKEEVNTDTTSLKIPKKKSFEKTEIEPTTFEEKTTPLSEEQKQNIIKQEIKKEQLRKHRSLQNRVRTLAHQQGFKAILEEEIDKGKRVDVGLHKDSIRIAVEISVTNTTQYEVQNIQKCIEAKYTYICMLSNNERHLNDIKSSSLKEIDTKHHSKIFFVSSDNFSEFLNSLIPKPTSEKTRIKGYRVTTNYETKSLSNVQPNSLSNIIIKSIKKKA